MKRYLLIVTLLSAHFFVLYPQENVHLALTRLTPDIERWILHANKECKDEILNAARSLHTILELQQELYHLLREIISYRRDTFIRLDEIHVDDIFELYHLENLLAVLEQELAEDRQEVFVNFEGVPDAMDLLVDYIENTTEKERSIEQIREWKDDVTDFDKATQALSALNQLRKSSKNNPQTNLLFKIARFRAQQTIALQNPEGPARKLLDFKPQVEKYEELYDGLFDSLTQCDLFDQLIKILPSQYFIHAIVSEQLFFAQISTPEDILSSSYHEVFSLLAAKINGYPEQLVKATLRDLAQLIENQEKKQSLSSKSKPKKKQELKEKQKAKEKVPEKIELPGKVLSAEQLVRQFKSNLRKHKDAELKLWGKELFTTFENWTQHLQVTENKHTIIVEDPILARKTTIYLLNTLHNETQIIPDVYPIAPRVKDFLVDYNKKDKDSNALAHTADPFTIDLIRQKGIVVHYIDVKSGQEKLCKNMLVTVEDLTTGQKSQGALQAAWGKNGALYHLFIKPVRNANDFKALAQFLTGNQQAQAPDILTLA